MSVFPGEMMKDDLKRPNDNIEIVQDENEFNTSNDNISIMSNKSLLDKSLENSAKKIKLSPQEREKLRIEKEQLKKEREMLKMQREVAKLEREKARIEREKLKVAREKQLMEERDKKQKDIELKIRMKEEEKERKEKLKKEREEIRMKNREAKEKEKLEKITQAQEESKAKEMKALQEKEKLEKSRAVLFNFLKKSNNETTCSDDTKSPHKGLEDSFETTNVPEFLLEKFDAEEFIRSISEQNEMVENLYLNSLLSGRRQPHHLKSQPPNENDDCEIIEEHFGSIRKVKYIFLKFYENVKPPYFGPKPYSSLINGRTPTVKVPSLDYEVDSDDEWEEGGPGESLSGSDSEPEDKDDYEIDNDFFVPHGYLSDDEFNEDGSANDGSGPDKSSKKDLPLLKEQTLMAERSRRLNDKLIPEIIGCIWLKNKDVFNEKFEFLEKFKAVAMPK